MPIEHVSIEQLTCSACHVFPELEPLLQQYQALAQPELQPGVVAFGQYNVGKSSLLNALSDKDAFKVADKRETSANQHVIADGVRWIDTPGLSADISARDDTLARQAATMQADLVLMLHNITNGELGQDQLNALQQLAATDAGPEVLLVLTRIDELAQDQQPAILTCIEQQVPSLPPLLVSSRRYQAGQESGQDLLITLSGIPELKAQINNQLASASIRRTQRLRVVVQQIEQILSRYKIRLSARKQKIRAEQICCHAQIKQELDELRRQACHRLELAG
ncbi:GTPase [Photobacterium aquae]|uniref:GTPase n=1 Tax=Photobacterium aquae TaxID=1195763 RepID=UPI00069E4367|nr:GTPase [Photobacterium aquae]